jgi:hypothetical protein
MEIKVKRGTTPPTEGGWVWYVTKWKEINPGVEVDYHALMAQYVKGVPYAQA